MDVPLKGGGAREDADGSDPIRGRASYRREVAGARVVVSNAVSPELPGDDPDGPFLPML